ncbi:transporter substrate-binding domain-containing protein [Stenotrophomonas maltophilia]|nr:transporter substrate-binding domain-containing protein [Stenotrophomonas maltophilia]
MIKSFACAIAALLLLCATGQPASAAMLGTTSGSADAAVIERLSPSQRKFIQAHREIVVGFVGNWPPFEMLENGQPSGLSPELLSDVASRLGLRIRYQQFEGFQEVLSAACAGRLDVVMNASLNAERTRCLVYTDSYAEAPIGLVAHASDPQLRNDPDLVGVRLVSNIGTATEQYAKERFPRAVHLAVNTPVDALVLLAEGKADAYLGDAQVVTRVLRDPRFQRLALIRPSDLPYDLLHFAVPNSKQPFAEALNVALHSLSDAERKAYDDRWLVQLSWNERGEFALSAGEASALRQPLRVGWPNGFAPISFADGSGRPSGLASEYLRKLRVIGAQFRPVEPASWHTVQEEVAAGSVDMAMAIPRDSKWLGDDWLFSQPFVTVSNVIAAGRGSKIHSMSDLNGLRVAVSDPERIGSYILSAAPQAVIVPVPNASVALQQVGDGRLDAYVGNLAVVDALIRAKHPGKIEIAANAGFSDELSIAVQRRHAPVVAVIDRMLLQMDAGEKEALRSKWLAVSYNKGVDWATLWRWLGPLLGVLVTAIAVQAWNQLRLSREVQRRRETEVKLEEAREAAERAASAKAEFLATMSHEIRTPMSAVMGMVEVLGRSGLTRDQKEILTVVNDSARTLRLLLDDVLDVSRLEGGGIELSLSEADVSGLMSGIGELMEPDLWRKGVELNLMIDPDLAPGHLVDELRLRQILLNLVSNATKFTSEGAVELSVEVIGPGSRASSEVLRFAVVDTGIGMSPEQQQRVLQPFVQATAATAREHGGTGLGLTIVAGLLELMGASLRINSELGRGTEMSFDLDVPKVDIKVKERHQQAPLGLPSRWRVLVAEDDAANRVMMQHRLELLGQQVTMVSDGNQALMKLAGGEEFDILLTDCQMPRMDGYELMGAVRAMEQTSSHRLPIIAMTASASESSYSDCIAAGADSILFKPFDIDSLRAGLVLLLSGEGDTAAEPQQSVSLPLSDDPPGLTGAIEQVDAALQGLQRQLGGRGPVAQVVRALEASFKDDAPALREALLHGRMQESRRLIHRIAGGLAMTGLTVLADEGKLLETQYQGMATETARVERFLAAAAEAIGQLSERGAR